MASRYSAPGVYVRETDESLYVRRSASAVAGFVGVADKGPVGEPVLITNWAQFMDVFGGFRADSYLAYAVKAFFDNGGGVCYVTRTVHYTDPRNPSTATADVALVEVEDYEGDPALLITAATPGAWANGYTVEVVHVSVDSEDLPLFPMGGVGVQGA